MLKARDLDWTAQLAGHPRPLGPRVQPGALTNNPFWAPSDVKAERRPPSPDVILLSDSEQPCSPRVNGLAKVALPETSAEALLVSGRGH